MPDLPGALEALRADPADGSRWLALTPWLGDDAAAAVRVFWPTLRDNVTKGGVSVDATLVDVARNARVLVDVARQVEANRPPDGHAA
jgi:hypothetical protein